MIIQMGRQRYAVPAGDNTERIRAELIAAFEQQARFTKERKAAAEYERGRK